MIMLEEIPLDIINVIREWILRGALVVVHHICMSLCLTCFFI